jgi:hypothetical protein
MSTPTRTIELDEETAEALQRRAAARGLSVAELVADLAWASDALPPGLQVMRDGGQGPWSPEALERDARALEEFRRTRVGIPFQEVKAWMDSWGKADELAPPVPRKL